ncbi:LPS export ABC transporter permease LptG [Sphingomonas mesophila]|uniref:LPS export ABC transporter permease LptG n=1 Tax=Sphingomonas mesophila TaxID=2303576 RepID=UPI000E57FCCF|nr:LPS export ABC transporter permease LptG [Sphingomonas mesophila]
MSGLDFLPSRRIALYLTRLFLTRTLAVLVLLVLVLMSLDLLGESGKILRVEGNGEAELWRYVSLRVPLLIQRFLPFSALLGTLIALVSLNQNSEIVAMKSAGLSAHQILAPMLLASLGLAGIAFAFNEAVAVDSTRTVNAWSDNDYEPLKADSGVQSNVWVRSGDDFARAKLVVGRGANVQLRGVTLYQRENDALARIVEAERGVRSGAGWRLEDVRIYDSNMNVVRRQAALDALGGVTPDRFNLAKVRADEQDVVRLKQSIAELEAAGRPTDEIRAGFWHKFSGPLSVVLMPLLAAIAAFGLARSGKVLLRAAAGMALGFAFFVVDNLSLALGNAGAYPGWLAAWAPLALFAMIGEAILVRSEE